MKNYDYMHSGLSNGVVAHPGRIFTVLRTKQKLEGLVDGWMATKTTQKTEAGTFRLFVREGGSTAWFGVDEVLR